MSRRESCREGHCGEGGGGGGGGEGRTTLSSWAHLTDACACTLSLCSFLAVRGAFQFIELDANSAFLLANSDLPAVVASAVTVRDPAAPAGTRSLWAPGIAGLVCATPAAASSIVTQIATACAASNCSAPACRELAVKGTIPMNWGVYLGNPPTNATWAQQPPPLATPSGNVSLPEPVLRAHYAYRRYTAFKRCMMSVDWRPIDCLCVRGGAGHVALGRLTLRCVRTQHSTRGSDARASLPCARAAHPRTRTATRATICTGRIICS